MPQLSYRRALNTLPTQSHEAPGPILSAPTSNIPWPADNFIGRDADLAQLKTRLTNARLLTITGPAGGGKTRLAIHLAAEIVKDFQHGVWLVELAGLTDPLLIPQTLAAILRVREQPNRLLVTTLLDYLRSRRLLLILDNCEHLVEACAGFADELLRSCPQLCILATSRQPLGVGGETVWTLSPLACPPRQAPGARQEIDDLAQYEAVRLFVDRASSAAPGFSVTPQNIKIITHICQTLDGIPLAIELAAARVRFLSVEQVAQRLDHGLRILKAGQTSADRHQTLEAAFDWSYSLLTEPEKTLLRCLAIFRGSFSLPAVEAVIPHSHLPSATAPPSSTAEDGLETLSGLVDKSLVVVIRYDNQTLRYRLLEPIRKYAWHKLQEAGEIEATLRRLTTYCLSLAETAEPHLDRPDQEVWLDQLNVEQDNMDVVLHAVELDDLAEPRLRLAAALAPFWHLRGRFATGRAALNQALTQAPNASAPLRAKALVGLSLLDAAQSHFQTATTACHQALALYQALGDQMGEATCLKHLGSLVGHQGDYPRAMTLTNQCLTLYRTLGDEVGIATALNNLGAMRREQGDKAGASVAYSESLTLFRRLKYRSRVALVLYNSGELAYDEGELPRAMSLLEASLLMYQSLKDAWGMAINEDMLGRVATALGRYEQAVTHYLTSLRLWRDLGNRRRTALALEGLAGVALAQADGKRAARLLGAAEALRADIQAPLSPADRASYERGALTFAQLQATFPADWMLGQAIPLDETLDYAMTTVVADAPAETATDASAAVVSTGRVKPAKTPAPRPDDEPETGLLQLLALGPARVSYGERPGLDADLGSRKPKEMLFYLLSHPSVSKEQIGLALWPQISENQLRSRFHETMHRLRRVLGKRDWIVVEHEHYFFNRQLTYWFDVEEFQARLKSMGTERTNPDWLMANLPPALALYRGDFLMDMPISDWMVPFREELQQTYFEALRLLGQAYFSQGRYAEASDVYRRILNRDKYQEEAHRRLMVCLTRLGQRSAAVLHYRRLVQMLRDDLKFQPDAETSALYERLMLGENE